MNCTDFVESISDYLDGSAATRVAADIERHLAVCPKCVRYKNVLENGARVLRSLPEPELREDFGPRLQHRLFHVDDERVLSAHGASGAPALTVLGIAVLLTAVAWSPTLFANVPVVELPAIVVDRAPTPSPVRPAMGTPGTFGSKADLDVEFWANTLLYEYTPLSQRYGRDSRARRVSDVDR